MRLVDYRQRESYMDEHPAADGNAAFNQRGVHVAVTAAGLNFG